MRAAGPNVLLKTMLDLLPFQTMTRKSGLSTF